jgi:RimJ/RimL family protein N-acetyltransferase
MEDHEPIIQLTPTQVTPELKAMFVPTDPAALRCQAVLDGHAAGKIFTDHPETPRWGVLQEATFGSLYLGGDVQSGLLHRLIATLRKNGEVLAGLQESDPRWILFPSQAYYTGYTLEFTDREPGQEIPPLPAGCDLRRLDHSLSKQILDRNLLIRMFGSIQSALEWGYGLCLMQAGTLLCEAFAGPAANGMIEIGVETQPHYMQKGYAFLTCAHLIHRMEQLGYLTYWNCAKGNLPSAALARKLGYQTKKAYRLLAWSKDESGLKI